MNLETIDKLYLELSQFTTAKTMREIALEQRALSAEKCIAAFCEVIGESNHVSAMVVLQEWERKNLKKP